jgi:chemotaxis protein CheD
VTVTSGTARARGADAPSRYFDPHLRCEAVKVLPGEYFATGSDIALVTVLGSCVAACIRDRESGIGGMNHFMLPHEGGGQAGPASASARYGVHAMELLINRLIAMGARRPFLEAKVFGGGNVLAGVTTLNVGRDNARFVAAFLADESIPMRASDLEGTMSRKVYFFPSSGRVVVRALRRIDDRSVAEREERYRDRLRALALDGEVEIFE